MQYEFCTLFDINYLPRGLTLYRSLERFCPAFRLRAFCMDAATKEIIDRMHLPHLIPVSLDELEAYDPDLLSVKSSRTQVEYCWTAVPSISLYALDREPELKSITYLDSDLVFFQDPVPIFEEFAGGSILIVPHRFSPQLDVIQIRPGRTGIEFVAAQVDGKEVQDFCGIYNVGFTSFRNSHDGLTALRWWRDRCLEWCYDRFEDGRWGDQKYLDDWPERFQGVRTLEHPGGIVAPWNVGSHMLEQRAGRVLVDGHPLIFYHHATLRLYCGITTLRSLGLFSDSYHLTRGPLPMVWTIDFRPQKRERELISDPYLRQLGRTILEVRQVTPGFSAGFTYVDPWQLLALRLRSRVKGIQAHYTKGTGQ